jgi:APA family basic amino acid/polyamine antiporter
MVLRRTEPELPRPVRCWGYPLTPLIFIGISGWMMTYQMIHQTRESLAGLVTILIGAVLYFISPKKQAKSAV